MKPRRFETPIECEEREMDAAYALVESRGPFGALDLILSAIEVKRDMSENDDGTPVDDAFLEECARIRECIAPHVDGFIADRKVEK